MTESGEPLCEHCKRNMPYLCEIGATCLDLRAAFEAGRGQERARITAWLMQTSISQFLGPATYSAKESLVLNRLVAKIAYAIRLPAPPDSGDTKVEK